MCQYKSILLCCWNITLIFYITVLYFNASFELLTSDTNKDNEILVMLCAWFAFLQGTVNALWQLHNHTKANTRDENDIYKEEGICNEGKIS